jgi:uncharacterized protein
VTPGKIAVEVALAEAKLQTVRRVLLPEGSTVADALTASGLEAAPGRVGVYGKVVPPGTILRQGDRVEIYRPLLADPKELRRARAARRRAKR